MPKVFSMTRTRLVVSSIVVLALVAAASLWYWRTPTEAADDPKPFTPPPTAYECRWTETPITIDGKADEEAWKHAQTIDNFYLPWLGKNARAARTKTRAKLLWDRDYLYFFADMEDADLYADIKEHNGMLWDNDVFELFFKPAADKPGYYEFQVNAAGAVLDLYLPRRGAGGYKRFKNDTTFHIEAKVVLRGTLNDWTDKDEGWSVEGRIPWKDFQRSGGRPASGDLWKFSLCRYDYSVDFEGPELSTCSPLKVSDFHRFEDYATLKFVGADKGAAKPFGIDKRIPLTTSKVVGSPEPPLPYRSEKVYKDLKISYPIAIKLQPDSDRYLLITEGTPYGPTKLQRMKVDQKDNDFETLLDMKDNKGVGYEIAFHPDFKNNGYMYLGHNDETLEGHKTRITRYTIDPKLPYKFDPSSAKIIIEWLSDGHNGGAMAFGKDGMLYVTSGDGTSDSDGNIVGQDMTKLLAKVLRIDVDHPDKDKAYSVPKDNPFVGMKDVRPETWAYGLRNPWRLTVDKKTGHVWVCQNGQDLWEQAYLVKPGENYGWSVMEGSHPFYPNRKLGPTPLVKPTVEHHHSEARSLTGGIVYYGEKYPELQGAYIYGDYSTGNIWAVKHDGTKILWHKQIASTRLMITGFAADARGELLICDHHKPEEDGGFYTLVPTPKDLPPSTFPRKLSDSGLFKSVKGHVMEEALIPYSVNAPLWSDGAYKQRWIGLPGDSKMKFRQTHGWDCPDKTVLVKSFALEIEEGNPQSRRWIETRFLTNQEGEWFGYSYLWNEEQTDGTLVEAAGADREYTIKVPKSPDNPDGIRRQKWHYPSRTECMVCHSRAANWVLGLSEVQMNKIHDYGGVQDNQLRTLEHIGALNVKWTDNPDQFKKLVDPYDAKQDIDARARSYLHANCSQCHVHAGGGNAQIELDFLTKAKEMNVFDVVPQHHKFDLPDAKLIAPGHPERSVLLHRMATRDAGFMPPLATNRVDKEAVKMMEEWIKQLLAK